MTVQKSPEAIRTDIATILAMWKKNTGLSLPDLDLNAYQSLVERFQQHDNRIKEIELDRDAERVAREEVMVALAGFHTRLRSATRGIFGPNSAQMNQAGMVRSVDRKSRHDTASENSTTASAP